MTTYSNYIKWKELCAILRVEDFEVFKYLKMGLPIYSEVGKPKPCPKKFHQYNILEKEQFYILKPATINNFLPNDNSLLPSHTEEDYKKAKTKALEMLSENQKDKYSLFEIELSAIYKDDPLRRSWKYFNSEPFCEGDIDALISDLKNCLFNIKEIAEFIASNNIKPIQFEMYLKRALRTETISKRKTHRDKIKEECREIAARIWDEEKITIAEMCKRPEIKAVAFKKNGKPYKEMTIRKWIRDLSPDRSPGRRPKKT